MQGIEILNKEPIYDMPKSMVVILVVAIVGLIMSLAIVLAFIEYGELKDGVIGIVLAVICIFLMVKAGNSQYETGRYTYEATIDENVSINEVYKHYDVIEQNGKKWILEDKECAE